MPNKLKLKSTQQKLLQEELGKFQNEINSKTVHNNSNQEQDNLSITIVLYRGV